MALDSPQSKQLLHTPARTYGELTGQQVLEGNALLVDGARKTGFTEYTSRAHQFSNGYGDSLGPREVRNGYGAENLETSSDVGPNPGAPSKGEDASFTRDIHIGLPLIVFGVIGVLLAG